MNKNLLIIAGAVLVIAIGGYLLLSRNTPEETSEKMSAEQGDAVTNMVMNAFDSNGSVKCGYSDENSQGTAYIKNGMVRVESSGTGDAQYGNVIVKNDTMWTWSTNNSEGFMMENISQYKNDPAYSVNPQTIRENVTNNNATCHEEQISDSMFEVPANIKFQNMSSMMEDIKTQLPEGVDLPEGFSLPTN